MAIVMLKKLGQSWDDLDVLSRLGLQHRRSTLTTVLAAAGLVGAGLVVGAGLTALLSPRSGPELRGSLKRRLSRKHPEARGEGPRASAPPGDGGTRPEVRA